MLNNDKIERLNSLAQTDSGYAHLVSQISDLWNDARTQAISAVNTLRLTPRFWLQVGIPVNISWSLSRKAN